MIATLEEPSSTHLAASGSVVASLEGVSKNYGAVRALRNVNFTVCAGQVVALLGPNGAGKTTDLLFLDEPTVGLDVEARRALWEEIRRLVDRGKTVLLTTHYLEEADALADRIAVINQGEIIAESTPAEIKAQTSGKRIRCLTSLSVAVVLQIPGVTDARQDREAVEIHAREAEPVVRALLARDASLSGLEITSAGLEEAFLALTQDNGENGRRKN